jgi:hypothetical protein
MSRPTKSLLLDQIDVLVRHFGLQRVRAAVAKFSAEAGEETDAAPRKPAPDSRKAMPPPVASTLELIRERDPEKHFLLGEFLSRLKDRKVLPESEDIRLFAQFVGLKDIRGKSRKDMIAPLMRYLLQRPTASLRVEIPHADNISEQQRREGFSVLTDKILGHK